MRFTNLEVFSPLSLTLARSGGVVSTFFGRSQVPENATGAEDGTRPLRRDAERNRQRILEAATQVFNERGLDVSLDEIARHAGVGVGTVYRRFRTKEELIEALFLDRLDSVAAIADEAYANPDAWCGLFSFMKLMAYIMAGNLGLRQMLM